MQRSDITGNFIQCLRVKNAVIDRWFIEGDDVEDLNNRNHPVRKLRYKVFWGVPEQGIYYRAWVFIWANNCIRCGEKNFPGDRGRRFSEYLKSVIRDKTSYSEIIIMKFATHDLTIPLSVTEDDDLLEDLAFYYSDALKEWLQSFTEDDLAPPEGEQVMVINNEVDSDDLSDSGGEASDEVD